MTQPPPPANRYASGLKRTRTNYTVKDDYVNGGTTNFALVSKDLAIRDAERFSEELYELIAKFNTRCVDPSLVSNALREKINKEEDRWLNAMSTSGRLIYSSIIRSLYKRLYNECDDLTDKLTNVFATYDTLDALSIGSAKRELLYNEPGEKKEPTTEAVSEANPVH